MKTGIGSVKNRTDFQAGGLAPLPETSLRGEGIPILVSRGKHGKHYKPVWGMNRNIPESLFPGAGVPYVCGDEPVVRWGMNRQSRWFQSRHPRVPYVCGDEPVNSDG